MNLFIFFMGMAFGLILMTSIYNAVLYYYNREKAFLYYALMQIGMLGSLFYEQDIILSIIPSHIESDVVFASISLFTFFFIVMFSNRFLSISPHLKEHVKTIRFILMFIVLDFLFYPYSLTFDFGVYLFIFSYLVYLAYLRVKQGSISSRFYLVGWGVFFFFVLSDEFIDVHIEEVLFNPMIVGSVLEAIILAIALSYQINERKKEQESQKQLLIHQSKLASMGEMLGNIAHQWRQPLTRLSYTFMNIEYSEKQIERSQLVNEGTQQLEFMSQTIDDFTNFYAPAKEKENFMLAQELQNILELVHHDEIEINVDIKEDSTLFNYKNEFKQVLLNLIVNAKDVLETRKINNPQIFIIIDKNTLSLEDNAGGINLENIEKIFEPYFTTKELGLGIGLYMSKLIIEKNMGGRLSVENTDKGALFTIVFLNK
ncbi:MAG: Unknown protein [uncultured Sulfurovum sp.]|uniref:histidine kinase n=1 Tax=uncultured Sulfurovum sp. TaxID=269237 RepID=A0A6S6TI87_9BACT|nr:MAG: Unknown protein [uncultured Sulfurovum sp.]